MWSPASDRMCCRLPLRTLLRGCLLALLTCVCGVQTMAQDFLGTPDAGKLTLVAGKDYKRHLIFCKGVVGDAGGCGTVCFYARYFKLKNSAPEFEFHDMQSYDFELDDMVHSYAKDEEELTNEEGEAIFESFGEPYDPVVEWHPLKVAE